MLSDVCRERSDSGSETGNNEKIIDKRERQKTEDPEPVASSQ